MHFHILLLTFFAASTFNVMASAADVEATEHLGLHHEAPREKKIACLFDISFAFTTTEAGSCALQKCTAENNQIFIVVKTTFKKHFKIKTIAFLALTHFADGILASGMDGNISFDAIQLPGFHSIEDLDHRWSLKSISASLQEGF